MGALNCVLYHNIGPETDFESGLNVTSSRERFEAQINWLNLNYDIIDLSTLLAGRFPRKPLLITFDDCYLSSFDAVREVLHPRGLPSVFFINPELLGIQAISLDSTLAWCTNSIGLNRLCDAIGVPVSANVSELIGQEMSKRTAIERLVIKESLIEKFGIDSLVGRGPVLERADIAEFYKYRIEVGNHTANHVHCRALGKDEQRAEILSAKLQLEILSGRPVRSFAVPYGHEADLTPTILKLLRESGHEAIFLVHARSNKFRPSKDIWYRVNLTNEMHYSLPLKLTVLPILRSCKRLMSR